MVDFNAFNSCFFFPRFLGSDHVVKKCSKPDIQSLASLKYVLITCIVIWTSLSFSNKIPLVVLSSNEAFKRLSWKVEELNELKPKSCKHSELSDLSSPKAEYPIIPLLDTTPLSTAVFTPWRYTLDDHSLSVRLMSPVFWFPGRCPLLEYEAMSLEFGNKLTDEPIGSFFSILFSTFLLYSEQILLTCLKENNGHKIRIKIKIIIIINNNH